LPSKPSQGSNAKRGKLKTIELYHDAEHAEVALEWTLPACPLRLDALVTRVSSDRFGLDLTVSSPYAASNLRARSSRPLLDRLEDRKRAHHASSVTFLVPATSFVPFAILTTGHLGSAARAEIHTQVEAYVFL